MIAGHDEPQAVGAVLENKAEAQADPQFKPRSGQFAEAQTLMPVGMAEIPLQNLQCPANFAARFPRIPSHRVTKGSA